MINRENFNWKKHIRTGLEATFFCALATREAHGVWACPVYFAYDEKLNLYFISMPKSRHMKNIARDPRVAVAIYSTAQTPGGDVKGIQLEGRARIVRDKEVEEVYSIYFRRRFPVTGRSKNNPTAHMGPRAAWKFVKIVPKNIYYFDTRVFDETRVKVPRLRF